MSQGDHLLICCDGIVEQMTSEEACAHVYEILGKQKSEGQEEDLAMVCKSLNKYSLTRGSKDNHSAMLIAFDDGSSYAREDEFIAGPYHPFKRDKSFSDIYLADAKKHGYEGEELFEMARQTEAAMPELAGMEDGGAPPSVPSQLSMGLFQAFMSQPGDNNEKLQMLNSLNSMLMPRGDGPDDDDDDDYDHEAHGADDA